MFDVENFEAIFAFNGIYLFLGAVIIFALSYYYYKRTVPTLKFSVRLLLTFIRFLALFSLLFLFFDPKIIYDKTVPEKPKISFFIDNSESTTEKDSTKTVEFLRNAAKRAFDLPNVQSAVFLFGERVRPVTREETDSIDAGDKLTDIASVFDKITETEDSLAAAVLLTDGVITQGENPADKLNKITVPVYVIALGKDNASADVEIKRLVTNKIAYLNNKLPVRVTVFSRGEIPNVSAIVSFYAGNELLSRKTVRLKPNDITKIDFEFVPKKTGNVRLAVKISPLKNERNTLNNFKSVTIKVLDKRKTVLFVSDSPFYDITFIKQAIRTDTNFATSEAIFFSKEKKPNLSEFVTELKNADAVFLTGFPTTRLPSAYLNALKKTLEENKPFYYEITPDTRARDAETITGGLFSVSGDKFKTIKAQLTVSKTDAPFFENIDNPDALASEVPPVNLIANDFELPAYFIPIFSAAINGRALGKKTAFYGKGEKKAFFLLASDIWRWKLNGNSASSESFDKFFVNIAKWLTSNSEQRRFSIFTEKKIFAQTESVPVTAMLYDDFFEPYDNATVTAKLNIGGISKNFTFTPAGNGIYLHTVNPLPPGKYAIEAQTEINGKKLKARTNFSVYAVNLEKATAGKNTHLLTKIARETDGEIYDKEDIDRLFERIWENFRPAKKRIKYNFIFFPKRNLLIFIILLFTFEWIIRKLKGLL